MIPIRISSPTIPPSWRGNKKPVPAKFNHRGGGGDRRKALVYAASARMIETSLSVTNYRTDETMLVSIDESTCINIDARKLVY